MLSYITTSDAVIRVTNLLGAVPKRSVSGHHDLLLYYDDERPLLMPFDQEASRDRAMQALASALNAEV